MIFNNSYSKTNF